VPAFAECFYGALRFSRETSLFGGGASLYFTLLVERFGVGSLEVGPWLRGTRPPMLRAARSAVEMHARLQRQARRV